MFNINTIVRPNTNADSEYSVCGNSVLHLAKVVETFARKENGNDMKIEILAHENPYMVGKKYSVDSNFFSELGSETVRRDPAMEEYIWIDAYKGTDANMVCKGKQYVMGQVQTFSGNSTLGVKGFHVCVDLKHCFKTYDYDFRNRFFKVRAKVLRHEYEYHNRNNSVLVAKAIEFVEEITDASETIVAKRASMN